MALGGVLRCIGFLGMSFAQTPVLSPGRVAVFGLFGLGLVPRGFIVLWWFSSVFLVVHC